MGDSTVDPGLLREARALTAELVLVNGLDASDFGDLLVDNLLAARVGACLVSSTRNGVGLLDSPESPHHRFLLERSDKIELATTVAGIERIRREGRTAIVFGLQVVDMIEEDVGRLVGLHAMGLRSAGLAYNVGKATALAIVLFFVIMVIIVLTFLCGLLPIIGNIISNTLIVGVGFTVSPNVALFALIFLVLIHKLEYFLNSKIVGDRIKNPMWLTLLGLILGEKLMGIPGMILAPVVLHYIKLEASRNKMSGVIREEPAAANAA